MIKPKMIKPSLSETAKPVRLAVLYLSNAIVLFFGMQTVDAASDTQQVLSATLQHRFKPTQQIVNRSRVVVNNNGYRLDSLPLEQGQVIITNLVAGKTWFVDTRRAFIHEVPFSDVVGAPELKEAFISLPGFIDSIPCNQHGGIQVGEVHFKGRRLQHWQCTVHNPDDAENNTLPVEQYFSDEHKLVVYSRSVDNIVTELLDISKTQVDSNVFEAPEGLHAVTIEQFMGQPLPLERYQEPAIGTTSNTNLVQHAR